MPQDDRNVLDVLKAELEFVTKGGYGRSPREPWRASLILEDSPTCMNFDTKENPTPCTDCLLMQFVPQELQGEMVPCRHIRLTQDGESIMDLYRGATQSQLEEALIGWLQTRIAELEIAIAKKENWKQLALGNLTSAPPTH